MNKNILSFDSLDQFKSYLKVLYETNNILGVKEWVTDNFQGGTTLSFREGPSGNMEETIQICDRRMELLDKNGIHVVNKDFLPSFSPQPDRLDCTLYLSLRILFIKEPFGIVIYKNV